MYNHAPENYVCPFCLLVAGIENQHVQSVQSDIVYRDDSVTAFIGSGQWKNNHGNAIIVPNEHFENIYDLPIRYAQDIHKVAKMLALAMKTVYACDGVSTRQHNEPGGSQDVWHYHLHVTPRYQGDNYYATHREPMSVDERAIHADKIRNHLKTYNFQELE
jgi:histidine triad (HIT) family protein